MKLSSYRELSEGRAKIGKGIRLTWQKGPAKVQAGITRRRLLKNKGKVSTLKEGV